MNGEAFKVSLSATKIRLREVEQCPACQKLGRKVGFE
jgi:hypothetical protein